LRRIIDKNDIDSEFKEIITKAFNEKTADNRSFLELAYLAQIDNIDENLQKISKGNLNERFADSPEWAARLILCKNGKFPLSNIIKAIESAPELYRVTVLFADLKDFKDPETINYLKNYLNSDKRLPGLKPTVPREPLARRAALVLKEMLKGFPDGKYYDFNDIKKCREWMSEQKKWTYND